MRSSAHRGWVDANDDNNGKIRQCCEGMGWEVIGRTWVEQPKGAEPHMHLLCEGAPPHFNSNDKGIWSLYSIQSS